MGVVSIFTCKSCGKYIVLDNAVLSKNGKKIPLDDITKKPHNCPNKPFNKETRQQWWNEQQRKAQEQREKARKEYKYERERQQAKEEAREKARKEYETRERQRREQRQQKDDNDDYKR